MRYMCCFSESQCGEDDNTLSTVTSLIPFILLVLIPALYFHHCPSSISLALYPYMTLTVQIWIVSFTSKLALVTGIDCPDCELNQAH